MRGFPAAAQMGVYGATGTTVRPATGFRTVLVGPGFEGSADRQGGFRPERDTSDLPLRTHHRRTFS